MNKKYFQQIGMMVSLFILNLCALCVHAQPIGQMVTITGQFQEVLQPAAIWVELRDPNAGATRPFFMRLESREQTQAFATYANDFVIQRIWLEFDDNVIQKPCALNREIISGQSVEIRLTGVLGSMFAAPQCHIKHYNTPPIQQSLMRKNAEDSQQLETSQPVITEESKYYVALKDCIPGAFRFKAYQPFIDEQSDTLVIIEGIQDNRCSVLHENHFQSVQGKETTAITRCHFSSGVRDNMTAKNIDILQQASQNADSAKSTFYTKAVCDECSATAAGKNLKCFEKFTEGTPATGATPATTTTTSTTTTTTKAP